MIKTILLLTVSYLIVFQTINAQHIFSATIILDKSIDAAKVHCSYDNGQRVVFVKDSFVNNQLILRDSVYTSYTALSVSYSADGSFGHSPAFFIGDTPAVINYRFKGDQFSYQSYTHAIVIDDTATNAVYRELIAWKIKTAPKLNELWNQHTGNEIMGNDSLRRLNETLIKNMNAGELSILKTHAGDDYSFWYFRDQIAPAAINFFPHDTSYLQELLAFLQTVYPPKFVKSIPGLNLAQTLEGMMHPLKEGFPAPQFSFRDIKGNYLQLSDFKGKYLLLDFWASWCVPCMKAVPFMKEVRKKYPAEKLVILGINNDREEEKFISAVKANEMNWMHMFDKNSDIARLFGNVAFPTTILIDKGGEIVYMHSGNNDEAGLLKALERM